VSAIKKGDLVMITKTLPCGHGRVGLPFIVEDVRLSKTSLCAVCGREYPAALCVFKTDKECVELYRIIKIDPPALTDETKTHKELTA
jgi:hypothetical protein